MTTATNIEWVPHVWNPITGCPGPKVSEGCTHCYAERMAVTRLRGRMGYDSTDPFKITYHYGRYDQFLKKRKHTRVFVNSMGDLFHPDVDQHELDCVFAAMLCSEITTGPSHEFLILTKRPDIMAEYFAPGPDTLLRRWGKAGDGWLHVGEGDEYFSEYAEGQTIPQEMTSPRSNLRQDYLWPLPNVWLGVTVCNQAEADAKIPILLETPAAKRFVSVEPMLGPVELGKYLYGSYECAMTCGTRLAFTSPPEKRCTVCGFTGPDDYQTWGNGPSEICPECGEGGSSGDIEEVCPECGTFMVREHPDTHNIDWVIAGGETGPGARPMHPDWVRSLRDQCQSAQVPFFFKSWGEWGSNSIRIDTGMPTFRMFESFTHYCNKAPTWMYKGDKLICPDGHVPNHGGQDGKSFPMCIISRVGKKRAGRLLDGREWNEIPEASHE